MGIPIKIPLDNDGLFNLVCNKDLIQKHIDGFATMFTNTKADIKSKENQDLFKLGVQKHDKRSMILQKLKTVEEDDDGK